jgi:outer membrane receptor protein involved in Fe transport
MKFLLPILFSLLSVAGYCQPPGGHGEGGPGGKHGPPPKTGEIFGNVLDSLNDEGLGYTTVIALSAIEQKMVNGSVSTENGNFSIAKLPLGKYSLKFTFVGYNTVVINDIELTDDKSTYQVKDLIMGPTLMSEVEVVGAGPQITYEIDKKIVNVEDQLNTEGQTAIEMLENIPSVSVAADGTVSLRGSSSFTLLIDGIPTNMDASDYLATIPASTIKEIEIITNPSAKFDAEGTSGIINIITKKNKLEGISFLLNGSIGRFNNYSGDFALNVKKKKFTFDVSGNTRARSGPSNQTTVRTTTYDSVVNRLESAGEANWRRSGLGGGAGFQWNPNNSHVLVVRTKIKSNLMNPYNDMAYQNFDNDSLLSEFQTFQHNHITFVNSTTSLNYQYNIKRNKDHYVSFKAIANRTDVVQNDSTTSFNSDTITAANLYTETGPSNSYRFNIDYRLPFKNSKLEMGAQSQFGISGDVGKNYTYDLATETYEFDSLFSSDVDYIRDVHAGYVMYGGKTKKFGYQAGLRGEYTYRTISSTAAVEFTEINRMDWFPSAHISYGLKNKSQLLASYSRRIERPRSYYFEPFITWKSPYNVSSGNPNLQPTYINSFEVNYMKPITKKGFFSLEAYFRKSENIVNRISTVYAEGILLNKPFNIGTANSYGLEASLNYKISKIWKLVAGANAYFYDLSGELDDQDYSTQSFNYKGRLTNTFTIKGWMLQFVTAYRSGSVTAQGENVGSFSQDISLKKSFMDKKLSMTIQGRNIFGTAIRESFSTISNVYIHDTSRKLAPLITVSASLKLNNYQKVYDKNEGMDDF